MKGVRRRFPRSMNSAVMERMTRGGDSNKGNLEKGRRRGSGRPSLDEGVKKGRRKTAITKRSKVLKEKKKRIVVYDT